MIGFANSKIRHRCAYVLLLMATSTQLASAQGLDRVRDRNGMTSGKISKMTALSVTLSKSGVDSKKPVEEILNITFAGEPENLTPAKRDTDAGRYARALEKLGGIEREAVDREVIRQEIDFLTTYCNVQLALSGQGTLAGAEKQVSKFLSSNSKSYRVPAAIELLGNVMMAKQDYESARIQFAKLGKAPTPYFKARSAILTGRSLQAEGQHQEAAAAFADALNAAEGNAAAQTQVLEATLGRAVSQSALGDVDQATATVKKIIAEAITEQDDENVELLAQAYNALGDCYLQAKQKKAANQAFLHVDLLFSAAASEHAKALFELSRLWEDLGQTARARDAKQRLQENYPGSRWAKQ
ncbi:MAG: tetratricopeptide repeat protein [Bythopirellula sp.]